MDIADLHEIPNEINSKNPQFTQNAHTAYLI